MCACKIYMYSLVLAGSAIFYPFQPHPDGTRAVKIGMVCWTVVLFELSVSPLSSKQTQTKPDLIWPHDGCNSMSCLQTGTRISHTVVHRPAKYPYDFLDRKFQDNYRNNFRKKYFILITYFGNRLHGYFLVIIFSLVTYLKLVLSLWPIPLTQVKLFSKVCDPLISF